MSLPFSLFDEWFKAAETAGVIEPNAMVLSTLAGGERPRSRVVLLKLIRDEVYYFFTNYSSAKSQELLAHPNASLNFHWRAPVHRQIRIEGTFTKASAAISDEYYATRPRGSQIGAWASPQSQPVANRAELEQRVQEMEQQFQGRDVPRPEFWGGFGCVPHKMEFWQEGEYRLHTRRLFTKVGDQWTESLLAP